MPGFVTTVRMVLTSLVSGVLGVAVVRAAKRRGGRPVRRVAVAATKAGIRGARAAEVGVEQIRLAGGDVLAQAREEMGEQARPPAAAGPEAHGHTH